MKKIFVIIIVAVISCFAITACGRNNDDRRDEEQLADKSNSVSTSNSNMSPDTVTVANDPQRRQNDVKALTKSVKELKDSISQLNTEKDSLGQEISNLSKSQNNIVRNTLPYLLLFVLFLIDITLFRRLNRHKRELKNLNANHNNQNVSPLIQQYVSGMGQQLMNNINGIKRDVAYLADKMSKIETVLQKPAPVTTSGKGNFMEPKVDSPQKIYMRKPSAERMFDASSELKGDKEDAYYILTIDSENPNKAKFEFHPYDDRHMIKAYENRTDTIDTACDAQYNVNGIPKSCHTNSPGFAERSGEIWKVITKAKVIYD
jgi:uncharacterized protein YoxC